MLTRDNPDRRLALIVASSDYRDPTLQQLRAPGHDASDLATVLRDPAIGDFDVHTLINTPGSHILRGIVQFCHQARPGDLVLVYLSCHGVLDSRGRLYYAAIDTEQSLLSATAVAAQWLSDQLEDCRARRQILLLDCCHSGAFARGSKGDEALALKERFSGRGKVVLTASGATEYSFEGSTIVGEGVRSVFTRAVVEGLRTGQADRDKDGLITVDDLYHHAYDAVRSAEPRQTPELWTFGAQGDLLIARSPRVTITELATLPEYIRPLIENSHPVVRESGVKVLADILDRGEPALARTARLMLKRISEEDLTHVAALAHAAHFARPGQAVARIEAHERVRRDAERDVRQEPAAAQKQKISAYNEDRSEIDLGPAAGVTDKGLRHRRNEDAIGIASETGPEGPSVVGVVCDGVGSSARPDEASQAAIRAALPVLSTAARNGSDSGAASLVAVAAARNSIAMLQEPTGSKPATAFISVVASGYECALCWLGDSRAYWLADSPSQSRLLTQDDTAEKGTIVAGLAREADTMASPYTHVLTRWLNGEDGDNGRLPNITRYAPPGAGALLLCSDGLWSYAPEAADLSKLALPKAYTDPPGAVADLVKFALDSGGADNISAVLIPYLTTKSL